MNELLKVWTTLEPCTRVMAIHGMGLGLVYCFKDNIIVVYSGHVAILWAGLTMDFLRNGGQSGPTRDFTVCNIRCMYRAELILGR